MKTKYITTKRQCQSIIDKYGNVCRGCGGKLEPIKTVDNSNNPTYWAGCMTCSVFDNGAPLLIFKIAQRLVVDKWHRAYHESEPDKNTDPEKYNYWLSSQIKGTCNIVSSVLTIHKELNK